MKQANKGQILDFKQKRYNAICYQCRLKSFGLFNVHENNATYYQYCAFGWFYVHKKQRHLLKMLQKHRHDFEDRSKGAFGPQWITNHYVYHEAKVSKHNMWLVPYIFWDLLYFKIQLENSHFYCIKGQNFYLKVKIVHLKMIFFWFRNILSN